ncbi:MAG: hypothetical protein ACI4KF_09835 [Huintestinicola sp.]
MFKLRRDRSQLIQLLKEREKREKKLNKLLEQSYKKYSAENLKAAKRSLLKDAMTIDSTEYLLISEELKKRLGQ